jgi:hypothetical protein
MGLDFGGQGVEGCLRIKRKLAADEPETCGLSPVLLVLFPSAADERGFECRPE